MRRLLNESVRWFVVSIRLIVVDLLQIYTYLPKKTMPYEDKHRLFLQFMMSNHVVSEHAALAIYGVVQSKFTEDAQPPTFEDLHLLIGEINKEITSIDMELRIGTCEVSATRYVMLVNMVSSPINATMSNYTQHELAYFKKVVDEIVSSEDGRVSSIVCLNIEDVHTLGKSDFEKLMVRFVEEMWIFNNEGKYSLSVRSISELRPYLTKTYKDFLMTCALCSDIIFQGFRCEHCPAIGHLHCFQAYAKNNQNMTNVKCPGKGCTAILDNLARFLGETCVKDVDNLPGPPAIKKQRTAKK